MEKRWNKTGKMCGQANRRQINSNKTTRAEEQEKNAHPLQVAVNICRDEVGGSGGK